MKICVIGNSHLAAFKLAWDYLLVDNYKNKIELVFFGSAGKFFHKNVTLEGGYLIPVTKQVEKNFYDTSGGSSKIDFSNFDAVLLVGLDCSIWPLSHDLRTFRTYDAPKKDSMNKSISSSCLTQICIDRMMATSMFQIISLIRSASHIPIFIVPVPFPSEACSDDSEAKFKFLMFNACQSVQESYYKGIDHLCRTFEAICIHQPENTVTNFLFTKECFSKGSEKLNRSLHREIDYAHMNKEYGVEVLAPVLQNISKSNLVKI